MTGKTHMAAGIAASLAITAPKTPGNLVLCIVASAVGAVISDIDVSTSDVRKELNKVLTIVGLFIVVSMGLEFWFSLGIFNTVNQYGYLQFLIGFLLFLGICIFGKNSSHRTFTHSILGLVLLSLSVYIMLPVAVFPFAVAMASHIVLDLFNKKKVNLWYPSHHGIAFYLCSAGGIVNKVIFYTTFIMDFAIIGWILAGYFFE